MRRAFGWVGLGVFATAAVAFAQVEAGWKKGDPAPNISAEASDGKSYTLPDLTKEGPVFVLFVKPACPVMANAMPFYQKLHDAYLDESKTQKVRFVGVFGGVGKEAYESWAKRFQANYKILFDPEKKILGDYRVVRSPWAFLIDSEGKIVQEWRGYSAKQLEEQSAAIAEALGVEKQTIDFANAPASARVGCPF